MIREILHSVKRPGLLAVGSAVCFVAVIMLWVKFPSLVPLGLLIVVGIAAGVTFLVSEVIVVLRVVRVLGPPGQSFATIRQLPVPTLIGLVAVLVLSNAGVLYFYQFRPNLVYVLGANLGIVLSWIVGRLVAARYLERGTGRSS